MKKKWMYETCYVAYGIPIAKILIETYHTRFEMKVEVVGCTVYHDRRLTDLEAEFIKGLGNGLIRTKYKD